MAFDVLAVYATGAAPVDLALSQMHAGSQLDLVVANNADGTVGAQLGNAGGTFGTSQNSDVGSAPRSLVSGKFTADENPDVVTANYASLSLLAGNGNGTFQAPQSISLPGQFPPGYLDPTPLAQDARSIATGDLNGDGKLDLVVATETYFSVFNGCG